MRVKVGDEAPDFELASHRGGKLSELRGRKNVVVAFHPFAWTPVCEHQMTGYDLAIGRKWSPISATA